jgi:hypothetical protein
MNYDDGIMTRHNVVEEFDGENNGIQPIHIRFSVLDEEDEDGGRLEQQGEDDIISTTTAEIKGADAGAEEIKNIHSRHSTTKIKNTTDFSITQYFDTYQYKINKYKLSELKEIAKLYKIKGAKTKIQFVSKIHDYFTNSLHVIKIQSVCRGFFVRLYFKIKGGVVSYKFRQLCVNETDFYTMDSLSDIPFNEYFSLCDEDETQNGDPLIPTPTTKQHAPKFSYGFNINSLICMFEKNNKFINPYNRKPFFVKDIQDIFTHFLLYCILFKENTGEARNLCLFIPSKIQIFKLFGEEKKLSGPNNQRLRNRGATRHHRPTTVSDEVGNIIRNVVSASHFRNNNIGEGDHPPATDEELQTFLQINHFNEHISPLLNVVSNASRFRNVVSTTTDVLSASQFFHIANGIPSLSEPADEHAPNTNIVSTATAQTTDEHLEIHMRRCRQKIVRLRQLPIVSRTHEIFMEMDRLGNYTDSAWFLSLSKRKNYIFYSQLRELWVFRAQIPPRVKRLICPFGDPFLDSMNIFRKPYDQLTEHEIQNCCLNVIENMLLTSFDTEYNKIGCLHVLTALTVVSSNARNQYHYLYDSVV